MRIAVIGGGPAGLFFALLIKQQLANASVEVFEKNATDSTYGWGVVFSGRALGFIQKHDDSLYQDLEKSLKRWNKQTIVHSDQSVQIDGSEFSGIKRLTLLQTLQRHCVDCGVKLFFEQSVSEFDAFANYDLVVGADGVNSILRGAFPHSAEHDSTISNNRYIWFGTRKVFDTLSLIFRQNKHGYFVAHAYGFDQTTSTFIVECDEQTWLSAGFADMTEQDCITYCENIFVADLNGQPLMSNQSRWLRFNLFEYKRWHHDNMVLLGDAAKTVHFSIGSGTRTAMEDAIALTQSLVKSQDKSQVKSQRNVRSVLRQYETERKQSVAKLLETARLSMQWYENFGRHMHLAPHDFAMSYLTRGRKFELDRITAQAPQFAAAFLKHTQQAFSA